MSFTAKEDARIQRTRLQLTKSLISLLQRAQFKSITVKTICTTAHINRATFYKHYTDKFDLLAHVFEQLTRKANTVDLELLQTKPISVFAEISIDPLTTIINYQSGDAEFTLIYQRYFVNYYKHAFNQVAWTSTLPRDLVAYTLVNTASSFQQWIHDADIQLSESEYNHLFSQLINMPNISK